MDPASGCLAPPADELPTIEEEPEDGGDLLNARLRAQIVGGTPHNAAEWNEMLATPLLTWREKLQLVCLLQEQQQRLQVPLWLPTLAAMNPPESDV